MRATSRTHAKPIDDSLAITIVVRTPRNLQDASEIPVLVQRFVQQGVRKVWVQFKQDETDEYQGGLAFYPSKIAPIASGFEDDRIGRFIDELDKAGIEPYGWMPCMHDPAAVEAHPDWAAKKIEPDGQLASQDDWLCPNAEEAVAYESSIAGEIAGRYPKLRGLYVDFIRYDDDFSCGCDRCLDAINDRAGRTDKRHPLDGAGIRDAANRRTKVWRQWIDMRAQVICHLVTSLQEAARSARPGMKVGACVLPFSAEDYAFNTQAGQDLYELSRTGLNEIVLMGYWADWAKSPAWVGKSITAAKDLLIPECKLTCLLGPSNMSVRRMRLTLDAIEDQKTPRGYFHYWHWGDEQFVQLRKGLKEHALLGRVWRAPRTDVVIRIDTEPDYLGRYETVSPQMIARVAEMLEGEGVRGTFVTCAHLAELQTDAINALVAHGHEIACHAYNHEQLDALSPDDQIAVVDKSLQTFKRLGIPIYGFGAPRNSITELVRDRLMEWNLEYDASLAFDPLTSFEDPYYVRYTGPQRARIPVIPFIVPNDWDARFVMRLDSKQMCEEWKRRLDRMIAMGEPTFVLNTHQWIFSQSDNLEAVRQFVQYAKNLPSCRVTTLREAAKYAKSVMDEFELPMPTSGGETPCVPWQAHVPAKAPTGEDE